MLEIVLPCVHGSHPFLAHFFPGGEGKKINRYAWAYLFNTVVLKRNALP
jgi:hypothetical protein